jgi:catechol 2,3-dioxygenase-like lactoylglutathione lyase family enzyme
MCSGWSFSTAEGERALHRSAPKTRNLAILNLEQGRSVTGWGRMIFYVPDVDAMWVYLEGKGFHPESPRDASWGERYFHMADPDGHELSFARPI